MYRDLDVGELAGRLGTPEAPFLLDVREPDEFDAWAIPSAVNLPLGSLPARLAEIPAGREIVCVCASGSRSARAAEFLTHQGVRAANLSGGMLAWAMAYDAVNLELGDARIVQVRRRGKGCLSYLVGGGGEAFVVDPSLDVEVYLRMAAEHDWTITRVFDTHLHADHLSGARALAEATGAVVHLNPADTFDFGYEPVHDGDRYDLPNGVSLVVGAMHTPGHTKGSTVYLVGDAAVLTGDTLFVDSVGRPDLADKAEEFARDLFHSLRDKVLGLGDDALVLPSHYGENVDVHPERPVGATLSELRQRLPQLFLDEEDFVTWVTARTTPRPPNYAEIIKANMGRNPMPLHSLRQLEVGPNRCSVAS